MTTIGILSDNHGDWSPKIAEALARVDAIIHAGDIGSYQAISELEAIAPTTVVLGNTDGDLPISETAVTTLGKKKFFVQHIVEPHRLEVPLRERLNSVQPNVVVFGHTHKPFCETVGGILFLNPGSVTRPRGQHPPSLVRLTIEGDELKSEFIEIQSIKRLV